MYLYETLIVISHKKRPLSGARENNIFEISRSLSAITAQHSEFYGRDNKSDSFSL